MTVILWPASQPSAVDFTGHNVARPPQMKANQGQRRRANERSIEVHKPHVGTIGTSSSVGANIAAVADDDADLLPSLPNPAARSASSIVYAGSRSSLQRRLWTLLRQCVRNATSVS